jgi:hypothetical protein
VSAGAPLLDRLTSALAERALPDGSVAGRPGEPTRIDATAWAAVAWRLLGEKEHAVRASGALAAAQEADGRLSISPLHPGASWPTPAALLAWSGLEAFAEPRRRALAYLLGSSGHTQPKDPAGVVEIDSSIAGWPWVERTFSWVAPTALALLALEACGEGAHARAAEGRRLLLDRQLPSGGWNYGNTVVFGSELLPAPEESGPALAALAGHARADTVAASLEALARDVERVATPLTLGWGLLGLAAWQRRPADAEQKIARVLDRADRYGGYDSADLALVAIAAVAPAGLVAALRSAAK